MRILVIMPSNLTGGAEVNARRLVSVWYKHFQATIDVVLLSEKGRESHLWQSSNEFRLLGMSADRELKGVFHFLWLALFGGFRRDYDIVFTSHVHCNAFASVMRGLGLVTGATLIHRESTMVFSWFTGWKLFLLKALYRLYSRRAVIVSQTDRMMAELLANVPRLSGNKTVVLGNPVDFERIRSQVGAVRRTPQSSLSFITVCRLVEEKGLEDLLCALASFNCKRDWSLSIVGDGPLLQQLLNLRDQIGLSSRVEFLGYVENPHSIVAGADLAIVSSRLEGFPNVLLEKMCVASAILSTDCADGIANIPGLFVCEPGSKESIVQALEQFIDSDIEELTERREKFRAYAKSCNPVNYARAITEAAL